MNTYPYLFLTKVLLAKLQARSKSTKTAIVNVSSSISIMPGPYQLTYCCTKKFERHWSEALRLECSHDYPNLEVGTLCPMYVSTQMTHNLPPDATGVITASQYVDGAFKLFGNANLVYGPAVH